MTDDPGRQTESVPLSAVEYPAHTGPDGIDTEAGSFVDAMHDVVETDGYTVTETVYHVGQNDTVAVEGRLSMQYDPGERRVRFRRTVRDSYTDFYGADGALYVDYDDPSDSGTGLLNASTSLAAFAEDKFYRVGTIMFYNADFEASHAFRDGERTYVVYDVVAWNISRPVEGSDHEYEEVRLTNASGRMVMDERGVMHNATVSFPEPLAYGVTSYHYTLTPERPTIEEPEWFSQVNATTAAS